VEQAQQEAQERLVPLVRGTCSPRISEQRRQKRQPGVNATQVCSVPLTVECRTDAAVTLGESHDRQGLF